MTSARVKFLQYAAPDDLDVLDTDLICRAVDEQAP